MRYADNITIITEDSNVLEIQVKITKHASSKVNLEGSLAEMKIMTTATGQILKTDGQDLEKVKSYIFLGLLITKDDCGM